MMRALIHAPHFVKAITTTMIGLPILPRIGECIKIGGLFYKVTSIIWCYEESTISVYVEENRA
jgi:hypothetical protein